MSADLANQRREQSEALAGGGGGPRRRLRDEVDRARSAAYIPKTPT